MSHIEDLNSSNEKLYWPDLHLYKGDYGLIFYAEKRVIENAEQFIEKLESELKSRVESDKELQKESDSESEKTYQAFYYAQEYGSAHEVIEQVLQSQRKASILSIFSIIEGYLKALCDLVQAEFEFKLEIKDLGGGDDIHRYWTYLQKVYEIYITTLEPYYTPIKQKKYFRNKIAHNNSIVDHNKIQSVRQTKGLDFDPFNKNGFIINSPEFNINLLSNAEEFFDKLVNLMEERYRALRE